MTATHKERTCTCVIKVILVYCLFRKIGSYFFITSRARVRSLFVIRNHNCNKRRGENNTYLPLSPLSLFTTNTSYPRGLVLVFVSLFLLQSRIVFLSCFLLSWLVFQTTNTIYDLKHSHGRLSNIVYTLPLLYDSSTYANFSKFSDYGSSTFQCTFLYIYS